MRFIVDEMPDYEEECPFYKSMLWISDCVKKRHACFIDGLNLPSADVVPVRHGKWTHKPDVYGVVYCSECDYELHANSTSFCPNCGAKMRGGQE